jgi:dTDP-4-amino-4,6-dideoxygalactose transaminase
VTIDDSIPFLDLVTPHRELESSLLQVLRSASRTAAFIGGPMLTDFEESFAWFCDTRFCVGVSSGTDALRFALIAAGVGTGDVVVTVPNTFIATTEAISQAGALPEFVDIDERTYNMDPNKLKEYLETRCFHDEKSGKLISRRSGRPVVGIVPVHLYGQMADMDPILSLAENYGLVVIEDACQAHGAEYFSRKRNRWFKAGSMGRAAAFSFYPGKNLGACGEAGAITTNCEDIAVQARQLRDHGQSKKYYHDREGYNGRLDAIQAGFLKVKLTYLSEWNAARHLAARHYVDLFESSHLTLTAAPTLPYESEWVHAIYHLFVVRVPNRVALIEELAAARIGSAIHYPIPLHLQKAYANLAYAHGDFPVSERVAREVVSLPMYPTLTPKQQARVVDAAVSCLQRQPGSASQHLSCNTVHAQ